MIRDPFRRGSLGAKLDFEQLDLQTEHSMLILCLVDLELQQTYDWKNLYPSHRQGHSRGVRALADASLTGVNVTFMR